MNHTTVTETMLVKSMLVRHGEVLKYQIEDGNDIEGDAEIEKEDVVEADSIQELWQMVVRSK